MSTFGNSRFETHDIGTLNLGPSMRINASYVTYRDATNKKRWHGDLRHNLLSTSTNRYYPTKKGLSIKYGAIPEIQEILNSLKATPPKFEGDSYEVARVADGPRVDIIVSIYKTKDSRHFIDIREYVSESVSGFKGFTYRGIRFEYHNKGTIADLLGEIYATMTGVNEKEVAKYT